MRGGASVFGRPSRREVLQRAANGFGAVALAALLAEDGRASQVDTFDHKPLLAKYDGKDPHSVFKVEPTQFNAVGKVMASPWKFKRHGECGQWVSELFPHLARCVDDLAFVRSLTSKFPEHTSANYFLH